MSANSVVIGIPTFRRPQSLRLLLESLVPELADRQVLVIVADNDCGQRVPMLVREFSKRIAEICSIAVSTRGIAAVRNALVDAAYERAPGWQLLIMLDDDGEVQPGWFHALTMVARSTAAHVTGAAVVCPLPPGAGLLARNSEFALRERWPTGVVAMLAVGQNMCIARQVEQLVARPWFNGEYGLSGGEDHEFFAKVKQAGGILAWADEAVVSEPQPPERLSGRAVLYRSLTTGITTARIDAQLHGSLWAMWRTARYICTAVGGVIVHGLLLRKDRTARAVIGAAYTIGRLPGVSRFVAKRYARVPGR
ncbi:MAG: glycosyltransferase family A protein [Burkholderiaceae bacterium]